MEGFAKLIVIEHEGGYAVVENTFLGQIVAKVYCACRTKERDKAIAEKIAAALNDETVISKDDLKELEDLAKWMETCSASAKSDTPENTMMIRKAYGRIAASLRKLDTVEQNAHLSPEDIGEVKKIARELQDGSKYGGGLIDQLAFLHQMAAAKVW